MSNLYFLALALPEGDLESSEKLDLEEVELLLRENLSEGDFAQVEQLNGGRMGRGFLGKLYRFETSFSAATTAFRAEKLGRGYAAVEEPLPGLQELLEKCYTKPLLLHKALLEYRLKALEGEGEDPFSLDQVLCKVWRLWEIEQWKRLNRQKGQEKLEEWFRREG